MNTLDAIKSRRSIRKYNPDASVPREHITQMLATAPAAIIICGKPDLQENICQGFWHQDCGAAVQNILLAAKELGYGT